MTDKKFDDDIIKGLQRMSEEDPDGFSADVLDLINRQRTEIDNLNKQMEWLTGYNGNLINANTALSEEILAAKTEAYKEFAERAAIALTAAYRPDYAFWILVTLDNLLKEMVGEEE